MHYVKVWGKLNVFNTPITSEFDLNIRISDANGNEVRRTEAYGSILPGQSLNSREIMPFFVEVEEGYTIHMYIVSVEPGSYEVMWDSGNSYLCAEVIS